MFKKLNCISIVFEIFEKFVLEYLIIVKLNGGTIMVHIPLSLLIF